MRGQPGVWRRTERVLAGLERRLLRREVAWAAAEAGVDPEALLHEAEALIARARAAGARTTAEVDAFCAGELGLDPAAWAAELADARDRRAR